MFVRELVARMTGAACASSFSQKVRDLDVRIAVVRIVHLAAFAEQGVGLVEEQDRFGAGDFSEDPIEVLLGFADVSRNDRREIDSKNRHADRLAERGSRTHLPAVSRADEQAAYGALALGPNVIAQRVEAALQVGGRAEILHVKRRGEALPESRVALWS